MKEAYKPTPEEAKKAEDIMNEKERDLSKERETNLIPEYYDYKSKEFEERYRELCKIEGVDPDSEELVIEESSPDDLRSLELYSDKQKEIRHRIFWKEMMVKFKKQEAEISERVLEKFGNPKGITLEFSSSNGWVSKYNQDDVAEDKKYLYPVSCVVDGRDPYKTVEYLLDSIKEVKKRESQY